jgi:hypothetical protein
MYGISYMFRHYIANLREPSERFSIEEQSLDTKHNTSIHNILSTVPQMSIPQKALDKFPEDGNVMPKRVGDTIHNQ